MSHLLVSGRVSNHFDFEDLRQSPRIPRISVSLDQRFQRKITTQRVPYKGSTWSTCPRLVEKRFPQAATDQEVGSPVKFEASGGGSLKCLGEGGFPGARGGMGKKALKINYTVTVPHILEVIHERYVLLYIIVFI